MRERVVGSFLTGNQKEVSGAALYPMEILDHRLKLPGMVFCRSRQGEPKRQTKYRLQRTTENSRPTLLLHISAITKLGQTNCRS
jgi:hypothetical protein